MRNTSLLLVLCMFILGSKVQAQAPEGMPPVPLI